VLFGYTPSYKRLKQLEQDRVQQQQIIAEGSAKSEQILSLEQKLAEARQLAAKYELSVPQNRDLGEFLHSVSSLMNENNLRDQRIEPAEQIKVDDLWCIPVDLRCRGKLEEIFQFCRGLQLQDRMIRIQQFRLTNDSDFQGQVGMQTKAVIYYRSQGGES